MDWTKERPDQWVSGPYVVRRLSASEHLGGDLFEIVGTPEGFSRVRTHQTIGDAKDACSWDAALREIVADAPPLSATQRKVIAEVFADNFHGKKAEKRSSGSPKGLIRKPLGGDVRSNDNVLQEYRAKVENDPMWSVWVGKPEDLFRWRVEFDCGCVQERFGRTDDPRSLLEASDRDPVSRRQLPAGEYCCRGDHGARSVPLRDFDEWHGFIRRYQEADPSECPEWLSDLGSEYWDRIRRKESGWVHDWQVTLTCGHRITVALRDPGWSPEQLRSSVGEPRLAELRMKYANDDDPHVQKLLDAGWPELGVHLDCEICPVVRKVVAYDPMGWLVPRPAQTRRQRSPREQTERQLRRAEKEVERLRANLERIDGTSSQDDRDS